MKTGEIRQLVGGFAGTAEKSSNGSALNAAFTVLFSFLAGLTAQRIMERLKTGRSGLESIYYDLLIGVASLVMAILYMQRKAKNVEPSLEEKSPANTRGEKPTSHIADISDQVPGKPHVIAKAKKAGAT